MRTTLLAASLVLAISPALAADWTYRGHLTDQGRPANGTYNLEVTVYDSERGGLPVSAPILLPGIMVTDGAFAAPLVLQDSTRGTRWLSVAVRASGDPGGFEPLPSREKALLSPEAFCTGTWDIAGNAGNPVGSFLGTSDNVTLQLRANNTTLGTLKGGAGATSTAFGANAVASGNFSAIGGGTGNSATADRTTVAGGESNQSKASYASIGGGFQNQASSFAVVGGGDTNNASADSSVVGGGSVNAASAASATVGGGSGNKAEGQYSVVGGGQANDAKVAAIHSAILGGQGNTTNDALAGILSGFGNQAGSLAAVGSGDTNNASGDSSFIGSGSLNVASGQGSVVPGGSSNLAGGDSSFAGGNRARVRDAAAAGVAGGDKGTFIWADTTAADFISTGVNQFRVRAGGGVVLNSSTVVSSAPDLIVGARAGGDADSDIVLLTRNGKSGDLWFKDSNGSFHLDALQAPTGLNLLETSSGALLTIGGNWTNASSREWKDSFRTLDAALVLERVLAMRVDEWSYKAEGGVRHVGPMAEDFHDAFGLGGDAQHISTVDASGVALVAIQGLAQKVEAENAALRAENAGLRADVARVATLEQQLAQLTARLDAGAPGVAGASQGPDPTSPR